MDPNERLTGLASLGPSGGGQPPMPPMGGGQPPMPPMGGGQPPMPEPGMGEMAMQGQPMQEEAGMSIEEDAGALAQAVVGRTQGDIQSAVAVLDTAKQMLMASVEQGGQEPQMMQGGGYVDYKQGGGTLYREGGGSMSDSDMLRAMIMENLQKPAIQEQMMGEAMSQLQGQSGRGISDKDKAMAELMSYRMA